MGFDNRRCVTHETRRNLLALFCLFVGAAHPASAAGSDYQFEVVGQPSVSGGNSIVHLKLTHMPDGKPVSGALFLTTRMDMGPGGMQAMVAPVAVLPGQPGNYMFEVSATMAGKWALQLVAKVNNGRQTVKQTLVIDLPR